MRLSDAELARLMERFNVRKHPRVWAALFELFERREGDAYRKAKEAERSEFLNRHPQVRVEIEQETEVSVPGDWDGRKALPRRELGTRITIHEFGAEPTRIIAEGKMKLTREKVP